MTSDTSSPAQAPQPAESHLDRWGRWLTLGANIGVVLGLIILIFEVRQNAALTRAAMEQDKNNALAEIEFNISRPDISAVWVKAIRTPEALSDAEIQVAGSVLVAVMLQWDQMFQMQEAGLVSRARVRQHIRNTAPFYFGQRFAKHWWATQMIGWEGTPMNEIAGPIVAEVDENFLAGYLDSLKLPPPDAPTPEPVP